MRMIKFTEVTHAWKGTAIVRKEGVLSEVDLGVAHSDKKLKEVGAKELFKNLPEGTITVEVEKLDDVIICYEASSDEFKKIAKVVATAEVVAGTEPEPQAEGEAKQE